MVSISIVFVDRKVGCNYTTIYTFTVLQKMLDIKIGVVAINIEKLHLCNI